MIYKFEAVIRKVPDKDAAFIEIPFDVEKEFGAKRVKVKVKFDDIYYRGSIVRMGQECYMIGITKDIRNQMGKGPGDSIFVQVEKDEEIREVELPEDFKNELYQNEEALKFYNSLSYSTKRKYFQWITSVKKEETRRKRITGAILKLETNTKL
ncbi:YdeI/OmpD-associated family protein [Terrisporobacter glycolicus]|uniref:YdeI/OmpD-associated family protein n=1 Tax=Terrisporobacter glycolicus TaxID=36841 RepID=UPI003463FBBD